MYHLLCGRMLRRYPVALNTLKSLLRPYHLQMMELRRRQTLPTLTVVEQLRTPCLGTTTRSWILISENCLYMIRPLTLRLLLLALPLT